MPVLFYLCFSFLLAAIAYQDFLYKKIPVWLLALLLLGIVISLFLSSVSGIHNSFQNIAINLAFILLLLCGISVYFILTRGVTKIMDEYIGWGDVIFLFIASGLFSPVNFILYCLAGFSIAIILYGMVYLLRPKENREVPLAGILAVVLLIVISVNFFDKNFTLTRDSFFLDKITLLW